MPISGYILQPLSTSNKNTTHCEVNGEVVSGISVEYRGGKVDFKGVTKQGTKCYLYFDIGTLSELTFEKLNLTKAGDLPSAISTTACDNNTNDFSHNKSGSNCTSQDKGIYETEDDFGKTYVFRGTIDNNWVRFADMYWRIIRINGNGTIRMIYSGTTLPEDGRWANGDGSAIVTSSGTTSMFNEAYNDNTYVGYMIGVVNANNYIDAHKNSANSIIKKEIDDWYNGLNGIKEEYRDKIDVETGFCNDRTISTAYHNSTYDGTGKGFGTERTAYNSTYRLWNNGNTSYDSTQEPTLKCTNKERDLFTGPGAKGTINSIGQTIKGNNKLAYPVGLITVDEAICAGGLAGKENYGYWLYTGRTYWTMTPDIFTGTYASIYYQSNGVINNSNDVYNKNGVRPVINLKADTEIEFQDPDGENKGTISNPYVVQ